MQDNAQILGFTAGELSPWLVTRHDLQAYQRGAKKIENFFVQPYGGLCRRKGTQYVGEAASQTAGAVKLAPFRFSESDMLMLEFYPGGMRVYRDGVCLKKNGSPYVLNTPWSTAEMVASLRCMQVNDVVYVTTPHYAPIMLLRHDDTEWTYISMTMEPYPRETYLNQTIGLRVMVEPSGSYVMLETESGEFFGSAMNSKEYVIAEAPVETKTLFLNESMTIQSVALPDLSTKGVSLGAVCHEHNSASGMNEYYTCIRSYLPAQYNGSPHAKDYPNFFLPGVMRLDAGKYPYEVCGDWELRTDGTWDGQWELWRSYNTAKDSIFYYLWDWECIKSFGQDSFSTRQNWAFSGTEDTPCRMVLVCRASKTATVGPIMYFRSMGGYREYTFLITRADSPTVARARVVNQYLERPASFYTKRWSFGAFGARNGYPRFASMHQGRIWLGGANGLPTTLIASAVNDYGNFRVRSADDAALHLTIAADDQSRICWVCPMRSMLIGTSDSEWTLSAPEGGSITATNASFSRQSAVGSENKVAYGVENTVFYVQRGGKRMREISYKLEADGFTSTDASILAEHLFTAGVKEWVVQRGNSFHLWTLMNDGSLAVLITNPEQQVAAWQRVSFPGRKVLSLAAIPGAESSEDEVWFVMQNTANKRISIERITDAGGYIDGCRELAPTSGKAVSVGLHLAGLSGYAYPKGSPEKAQPVTFNSNGACDIPNFTSGKTYCIGAGYESLLHTMPFEREGTFNSVQQHSRVKLRLHESSLSFYYKGEYADRWETYEPVRDGISAPYTGAIRLSPIPSPGVGQGFCLRTGGAMDFALISLTIEVDFHGK